MKTITKTYNVYSFDELSEKAKQKAIDKLYDINVTDEWWEQTYEDASEIGLKITGFDIDRGDFCEGEFNEGACFTAQAIINNHGEVCETYKTATNFLKERDEIVNSAAKDENGEFEDEYELDNQLDELESEFLKSILQDYLAMLRSSYEYLTSEEAIIETIESNEYTFLENGTMKNF